MSLSTWIRFAAWSCCALCATAASGWQNGGYPATQYPTTQNPTAQYPTAQYPSTPYAGGQPPYAQRGLPLPPSQPLPTTQPTDWAGRGVTASDQPADRQPAGRPATARPVEAQRVSAEVSTPQDVQIVAIVGSDPILGSDIMPWVMEQLMANRAQIKPEELEAVQAQLIRQRLRSMIETKTVIADIRKTVPKDNIKNIEKKINDVFEKKEVPNLMKRTKATTRAELIERLQKMGTSLDREKQGFFEKTLAQQWLQEQVRKETEGEITHDEMLAWYRAHAAEYETQARVRWQQLMVRVTPGRPKGQAWDKICDMGNQVFVQRIPFADVAKQSSDGTTAADGGLRDWTTQGSLVSKTLDEALFSAALPVGKLSPVIEDSQGYHIVLVLEREPAGRKPFEDVQHEIKDKIKNERFQAGVKKYMAQLKKTPIWTMYDGQGREEDAGPGSDRVTERPSPGSPR